MPSDLKKREATETLTEYQKNISHIVIPKTKRQTHPTRTPFVLMVKCARMPCRVTHTDDDNIWFSLSAYISMKFSYAGARECMQWICKRFKWAHLVLNSISFGNIMCYIIIIKTATIKMGKIFMRRQNSSTSSSKHQVQASHVPKYADSYTPHRRSYGSLECDAVSSSLSSASVSRSLDLTPVFHGCDAAAV